MSTLESKETQDVVMSLDTKENYELNHNFTVDKHTELIEFLKTYDCSDLSKDVYLAPRDHLVFKSDKKDSDFDFKYEFGSEEAKPFTLPVKCVLISGVVRGILANDKKANRIPVLNEHATSDVMKHIVSYMKHQDGVPSVIIPDPITSKYMKDMLKDEWLVKFIDDFTPEMRPDEKNPEKKMYDSYTPEQKAEVPKQRKTMRDVMETLNYMAINCLLHTFCAKWATMIKGVELERMKGINEGTYEIAKKEDDKKDDEKKE